MMTTHIAWDDRALDSAFAELFGAAVATLAQPKTTKTYCGKRVKFENAQTFRDSNCGACIKRYTSENDVVNATV